MYPMKDAGLWNFFAALKRDHPPASTSSATEPQWGGKVMRVKDCNTQRFVGRPLRDLHWVCAQKQMQPNATYNFVSF